MLDYLSLPPRVISPHPSVIICVSFTAPTKNPAHPFKSKFENLRS